MGSHPIANGMPTAGAVKTDAGRCADLFRITLHYFRTSHMISLLELTVPIEAFDAL